LENASCPYNPIDPGGRRIPYSVSQPRLPGRFTPGKILNVPVLLEPANNATEQPQSVTLKWVDTNSIPQEKKYRIRIKRAGGVYAYKTVAANAVSFLKSGLARGETFYWGVRVIGDGTSDQKLGVPSRSNIYNGSIDSAADSSFLRPSPLKKRREFRATAYPRAIGGPDFTA
jgi:hypothetical protein